jgi:hypothetical protein
VRALWQSVERRWLRGHVPFITHGLRARSCKVSPDAYIQMAMQLACVPCMPGGCARGTAHIHAGAGAGTTVTRASSARRTSPQ